MIYEEMLDHVLAFASVLTVFVIALVQLVKQLKVLPAKAIPLAGLGIGLVLGAAAYPFSSLGLELRLWAGGLAGLSATGLFELAFQRRPKDNGKFLL